MSRREPHANLVDRCVEVYRDPDTGAGCYRTLVTVGSGGDAASQAFAGFSIPVTALLD